MENVSDSPNVSKSLTNSNSYKALMQMIRRQNKGKSKSEVPPGVLASFYIDCFLNHNRTLCAPVVTALGICTAGKFVDWREDQQKLGNLDWDIIPQAYGKPKWNYREGPKLMKHLARIAAENGMFATKGYVDNKIEAMKSEIKTELKAELTAEMEAEIDSFIEKRMPPVTPEKREALLTLAYSINASQSST